MTHLGSFGQENPVAEVTFDYFGVQMRANPEIGELDYIDFMETAGAVDTQSAEAAGLLKNFGRMCLHPDDFDTFWATAKKHRQGIEAVFKVLTAIVEAVADRPTERSSSSAATPTTGGTSSAAGPLARLEGRPDLQLVAQQAAQARVAG